MAITLTTYPTDIDSRAEWAVTTSLVEDSTHVNLRVEANLYKRSVLTAKKVMPKGYTSYDFTDILNDMIRFDNPVISDYAGEKIFQPADDAYKTNLITSWSNSVMSPYDTFTSVGKQITSAINDGTSEAICGSNTISFTKGKLYALVWDDGLINTMTDANTLEIYIVNGLSNTIKVPTDGNNARYYFMYNAPTGTANCSVIIKCNVGKSVNFTALKFLLIELSETDWYIPYHMTFVEKYEDASGITQTGATLDNYTSLQIFVKSETTTIEEFSVGAVTSKFMLMPDTDIITADTVEITVDNSVVTADGYTGETRAIYHSIPKTIPSGKVSLYYAIVAPYKTTLAQIYLKKYNASFVYVTYEEIPYEDIYHPILLVHVDQSIVDTYPIIGVLIRTYNQITDLNVVSSEEIFIVQDATKFPEVINLVWKNSMGGFSSFQFYSGITKGKRVSKEYYKNTNAKNRILKIEPVNYVIASTKLHLTEDQLTYLDDLLESDRVYWQYDTGNLVEVCVKTDSMESERNEELMQSTIEFEY